MNLEFREAELLFIVTQQVGAELEYSPGPSSLYSEFHLQVLISLDSHCLLLAISFSELLVPWKKESRNIPLCIPRPGPVSGNIKDA